MSKLRVSLQLWHCEDCGCKFGVVPGGIPACCLQCEEMENDILTFDGSKDRLFNRKFSEVISEPTNREN